MDSLAFMDSLTAVGAALPACRPLPVGKLTSMISARQGNVPLFGSLRLTLRALLDMLDAPTLQPLNTALLGVVREEAGITIPQDDLAAAARATLGRIDALLPAPPDEDFEMLSPSPPGAAADDEYQRRPNVGHESETCALPYRRPHPSTSTRAWVAQVPRVHRREL